MAQDSSNSTGFVAPTLEELVPLFPAYEIEAFIAQGGMGAVYKARQKSLDRPVAIKILPSEFGADPQFRASFEAEAKAMARLNHPNLISVYDFGDIEGMLYIVFEFVHGKALYYSSHNKAIDHQWLSISSRPSAEAWPAHRGGIIHRDIKPANILLDTDARPKIGDFGLAHAVDRNEDNGLVFGTPGYTAPEIYRQDPNVDERSDIFSVGALLYELISGKPPGKDTYNMSTGTDSRIDIIIKKATNPDPELRYADVDKLADELDTLIPKLAGPRFSTAPTAKVPSFTSAPPVLTNTSQNQARSPFFQSCWSSSEVGGCLLWFRDTSKKPTPSAATIKPDKENGKDKKTGANDSKLGKKPKPDRNKVADKPKPRQNPNRNRLHPNRSLQPPPRRHPCRPCPGSPLFSRVSASFLGERSRPKNQPTSSLPKT